MENLTNPENLSCPTCGYYCLGKGGRFCIDKPTMVEQEKTQERNINQTPTTMEEVKQTAQQTNQFNERKTIHNTLQNTNEHMHHTEDLLGQLEDALGSVLIPGEGTDPPNEAPYASEEASNIRRSIEEYNYRLQRLNLRLNTLLRSLDL